MPSRRGSAVNCAHDRTVCPARVVRNTRSASPVVHGGQIRRPEWPRAPSACGPLRLWRGVWRPLCPLLRLCARDRTRCPPGNALKIYPNAPVVCGEGLVGTLIWIRCPLREDLESRISISNLESPEMGFSALYGTGRALSHQLPQMTS